MNTILLQFETILKNFDNTVSIAIKERDLGITKDQWKIIDCIADYTTINQKEVASYTKKDPAALTRMLDILESKRLVKRTPSKTDRRSFELALTVDGSRIVRRFSPIFQKLQTEYFSTLNSKQQNQLTELLSQLKN